MPKKIRRKVKASARRLEPAPEPIVADDEPAVRAGGERFLDDVMVRIRERAAADELMAFLTEDERVYLEASAQAPFAALVAGAQRGEGVEETRPRLARLFEALEAAYEPPLAERIQRRLEAMATDQSQPLGTRKEATELGAALIVAPAEVLARTLIGRRVVRRDAAEATCIERLRLDRDEAATTAYRKWLVAHGEETTWFDRALAMLPP